MKEEYLYRMYKGTEFHGFNLTLGPCPYLPILRFLSNSIHNGTSVKRAFETCQRPVSSASGASCLSERYYGALARFSWGMIVRIDLNILI